MQVKLKNMGNYYIPDLGSNVTCAIDEYQESCSMESLYFILEQTSLCVEDLLKQYPMSVSEEEIGRLLHLQHKNARILGVDLDFCYHYFGRKDKVSHGITVDMPVDVDFIPIKITTTDFYCGDAFYQRRVKVLYDKEYECFNPVDIIEVEKKQGIVVQRNVCSDDMKKLSKKRNYIGY